MTVYVDALMTVTPHGDEPLKRQARRWGNQWCHMTATTDDELHAMAQKIGLKRAYAQHMQHPAQWRHHYDLIPSKRALAIKRGAVEVRRIAEATLYEVSLNPDGSMGIGFSVP